MRPWTVVQLLHLQRALDDMQWVITATENNLCLSWGGGGVGHDIVSLVGPGGGGGWGVSYILGGGGGGGGSVIPGSVTCAL